MDNLKRGAAAIVGVAESDLGQVADGMSPMDLSAQGILRALADCGLTLKDVDGLFCAEFHRLNDDRRLVVRVSRRAGRGRDRSLAVQRGGDRLWLDPAQRRPQ